MREAASSDESPARNQTSTELNRETAGKGQETAGKKGQATTELLHGAVTKSIIDSFFTVYNKLGFGFLENVYCAALAVELRRRGHKVAREVTVPVFYDGDQIARYRIDFMVDDVVVVEVKSTESLNSSDLRQLRNCLRATPLEVGLLLHFGPKPKFYRMAEARSS